VLNALSFINQPREISNNTTAGDLHQLWVPFISPPPPLTVPPLLLGQSPLLFGAFQIFGLIRRAHKPVGCLCRWPILGSHGKACSSRLSCSALLPVPPLFGGHLEQALYHECYVPTRTSCRLDRSRTACAPMLNVQNDAGHADSSIATRRDDFTILKEQNSVPLGGASSTSLFCEVKTVSYHE
jgi:hypothetical protein